MYPLLQCLTEQTNLKLVKAFLLAFGLMTAMSVPLAMSHVTNHVLLPDKCRSTASQGERALPFALRFSDALVGTAGQWGAGAKGFPPFANTGYPACNSDHYQGRWRGGKAIISFSSFLSHIFHNKIQEVLCFLELFQKQ